MLCSTVYFQSGDVNAALLLYVARQTGGLPPDWSAVVAVAACVEAAGRGGGAI